ADLNLELIGRYYTGQPVAGGNLEVELIASGARRPLTEVEGKLDATGKTRLRLELPKNLAPGTYAVQCRLRDESDQTVTHTVPLTLEGPAPAAVRGVLDGLPRFVSVDEPLVLKTTRAVSAEQVRRLEEWESEVSVFAARAGKVTVRWPRPGWYTLSSGKE